MKYLRNLFLAAVIVANLALIGGAGAQDLTTKPRSRPCRAAR